MDITEQNEPAFRGEGAPSQARKRQDMGYSEENNERALHGPTPPFLHNPDHIPKHLATAVTAGAGALQALDLLLE